MRGKTFFTFVGILFTTTVAAEESIPLPKAMAVLGDSMSEGMLAGYSLEKRPSLSTTLNILWLSSDSDQKQRMASYRKKLARPDLSWSSGNNTRSIVKSHAQRLLELQPDLKVANFAISGDESSDLEAQVDHLLTREKDQGQTFDYVTLLIGANDLASENNDTITSPLVYAGNVETGLRRLIDKDPSRSILVIGLPDVHDVFEKSADFVAVSVWGEDVTCKSIRRTIYGKKTVFFPENEEIYEFTKTAIAQYRDGLRYLVERLQSEFPDTNLKYIKNIRNPMNVKKALSIDCFHPSEWGQAEIAEMTWAEGFWPSHNDSDLLLWK